jgi:predicted DNA binding protein
MKNYFLLFTLLYGTMVFTASCEDDDDGACDDLNATYDGAVKGIINSSCAYANCHDGNSLVIPDGSKDYTSYATMLGALNAEKFEKRVLDDKNMPPANFVPEGSPTELSDAQLEILQCWVDAGYPEN